MKDQESSLDGQQAQEGRKSAPLKTGGPSGQVPAVGGRRALEDIRRKLTDEELQSSGVHKLLLDALDRADKERDELRQFRDKYHEADKRSAVLKEKLSTSTAWEIAYGVGLGTAGAIVGLAPYFWEQSVLAGGVCLGLGLLLAAGAAVARVVGR